MQYPGLILHLPNCWHCAKSKITNGRGRIEQYSLRIDRPADRHKWFFSYTEARDFILSAADKYDLKILELVVNEKRENVLMRSLGKIISRFDEDRYLNSYAHTLWAVFGR